MPTTDRFGDGGFPFTTLYLHGNSREIVRGGNILSRYGRNGQFIGWQEVQRTTASIGTVMCNVETVTSKGQRVRRRRFDQEA